MDILDSKTRESIEWDALLSELSTRAGSEPGKKFAASITPLAAEDARSRCALISEIKEGLIQGKWCDFSPLADVTGDTLRASKGSVLSLSVLFTVRGTVRAFGDIQSFYLDNSEMLPLSCALASQMPPCPELRATLSKAFTDDGDINGATYPQIGRIDHAIRDTKHSIEQTLSKIIHSQNMDDVLQEKMHTIRNDRYCLLVKANMKGRCRGTVQDVSGSSSTLFIEPEQIAHLNDELLMKRAEREREIEKIIADLSEIAGAHHEEIRVNTALAAQLDFLQGAAKFSRDIKGSAPEISDKPVIDLVRARHPLLQLLIGDKNVANDISLGKKANCIVITGANTGGKTVLLKCLGLSALCAAHGLHIAASPDSTVGIFNRVTADIGDDQNLEMSLSTFSGQIVALNSMLETCGDRTLILLDEIMAGTNPRHGAALAQSILESFVARGGKVAVSTHYPELRNLAVDDARFANASVAFNIDSLQPTYELINGIPGASFTFEIAQKYGVSDHIIGRARQITSSDELSTEALLEKINQYKDAIALEKKEVERLGAELSEEKKRYEEMRRLLKDETRKVKKAEGVAFIDEIRKFREIAAERIREIHTAGGKRAEEIRDELSRIEQRTAESMKRDTREALSESERKAPSGVIEPGTRVLIVPLEKEGVIEESNAGKRTAVVRLGSIFSRYSYDDLLITGKEKESAPAKKFRPAKGSSSQERIAVTIQTPQNTVDLRGMRADEALSFLDESLDRMTRSNIPSAVVIHGHGTGALKTAVRQYLKKSPYSAGFRPGEQSEGGDGVSIVMIG
jgi:DNA mismatch repair protein MutS2